MEQLQVWASATSANADLREADRRRGSSADAGVNQALGHQKIPLIPKAGTQVFLLLQIAHVQAHRRPS